MAWAKASANFSEVELSIFLPSFLSVAGSQRFRVIECKSIQFSERKILENGHDIKGNMLDCSCT